MTVALSRREFLKVSAALGGGLALEFCFPVASAARWRESAARSQCLDRDSSGRPRRHSHRPLRNGPGHLYRARAARRRGTRLRLGEGQRRICLAQRAHPAQPHLGLDVHRRQQGVRSSQDYVRKAGASARDDADRAAARALEGAGRANARSASGVITHRPTRPDAALRRGRRRGGRSSRRRRTSTLRDPTDWKIAGKPLHRLDIPDKVRGKPVFGVDVALPGMLHASIAQCPVFGGKVASVDARAAEKMRGVKKIVREEDFVAVVADSWWRANEALKKLKIEWDPAATAMSTTRPSRRCCARAWPTPSSPQARKTGRCARRRWPRRREVDRGRVPVALPQPRDAWSRRPARRG